MGLFGLLFVSGDRLDDIDAAELQKYVDEKLDEAADWRAEQRTELAARQARAAENNAILIKLARR